MTAPTVQRKESNEEQTTSAFWRRGWVHCVEEGWRHDRGQVRSHFHPCIIPWACLCVRAGTSLSLSLSPLLRVVLTCLLVSGPHTGAGEDCHQQTEDYTQTEYTMHMSEQVRLSLHTLELDLARRKRKSRLRSGQGDSPAVAFMVASGLL